MLFDKGLVDTKFASLNLTHTHTHSQLFTKSAGPNAELANGNGTFTEIVLTKENKP